MIFGLMLILAVLLMTPLFFSLRQGRELHGRRETALMLHRAQLDEVKRDLEDARIGATEYAGARLEIERRMLSADALTEPARDKNAKGLLVLTAVMAPVMAFLLYLPGSTPGVPSEPHAQWVLQQQQAHQATRGTSPWRTVRGSK